MRDRPLLVVAATAALVALGHAAWIWTHRRLGAFDPDESGYVATALRLQQSLGWTQPLALPLEIARSGTGPLVPLLSVPLLAVGPDDVRTALLVQPLLLVATAVSVAGIARHLAGPWAAITAGLVVLGLPTVASATVSYWLGLGAAASLAAAVWALLASERLTNRWTWAFGLAVAAMVLARTMAIGFVPGVAVAGVVVAGRDRRSLLGLVRAGAVAVAVAAPWFVVQRDAVFGYLFSYGYGDRSELFGESDLGDRAAARLDRLQSGVGPALAWAAALVVVALALWAWRRRRPALATREGVAVLAVVVLGTAALMSTANAGVWFELPIVVVAVALVVAAGAGVPWPVRAVVAVPVALTAIVQLGATWWIIPPDDRDLRVVDAQGRVAHYEWGFAQYDPRFGPDQRDRLEEAAEEWWAATVEVAEAVEGLGAPDRHLVTMSGSFQLFNTNTLQLAAQLDGWTVRTSIPDTLRTAEERAADLSPVAHDAGGTEVRDGDGRPVARVLILVDTDQHLFTPDTEVRSFTRQAEAAGWRQTEVVALPDGSLVRLMEHPDAPRG